MGTTVTLPHGRHPTAPRTDFQKAHTIRSNCKRHLSFHLVLAVLHDIFPQYKPIESQVQPISQLC